MSWVSILDVAHVGRSDDNLLLLFVEEHFSMQRDGLLDAEVPLVESALMGGTALHPVEEGFKSLNSVFLAVFSLHLLGGVKVCNSLFSELLDALVSLLDHVRGVQLDE